MSERDYVLGTHDQEIARLGLQHRVWRPRVLEAWQRAGFSTGQVLMDVGCGPGYAALDLAEIVGPSGRVIAVDRSRRFLAALDAERGRRGLDQVTSVELDLEQGPLPAAGVDGAWLRWVLAFVRDRRALVARVCAALRPGGVLVAHEYFDYGTWRLAPRCPELEEFVREVMQSWRAGGGEPDVGLDLPGWLTELDLDVESVRPIVSAVRAESVLWQWPASFVRVGLERLVDLGRMAKERAAEILQAFSARAAAPGTLMITPAVIEVVARRRL